MAIQRDIHSNITALALFFILGNSILYLEPLSIIHLFFSGMRMLAVAYAISLVLNNRLLGGYAWLICIAYAALGAVTYMHHGALNMWASFCLNSIGISTLTYYSIQRSPERTLDIFAHIFAIFIFANLLLMLPGINSLMNGGNLLGRNYNQVGATLLCGIIIHSAAYHMHLRTFRYALLICAICTLTPIYLGSMTSSVGCVIASAFLLIPNKNLRRITIISFFLFYMIFQALVVFMQKDLSDNKQIAYFVEDVLKKDLTFTDRARVWIVALDMIQDSPTTGYGIRNNDWFEDYLKVKSAHNIFLQVAIYGGYIFLAAFLIIIATAVIRSFKNRTSVTDSLLFGLAVFFFMMMMENYNLVLILCMVNILYYSPELSEAISPKQISDVND